jgi:hypothetical protein
VKRRHDEKRPPVRVAWAVLVCLRPRPFAREVIVTRPVDLDGVTCDRALGIYTQPKAAPT